VECSQSLGFDQVTDFGTWSEICGETNNPDLMGCLDFAENQVLEELGMPEGG
jgi:hypothetical protein